MTIKSWLACLLLFSLSSAAFAHENEDEDALVIRVKEEVLRGLSEGDFLKGEIQAGIQAYIDNQRDQQLAAEREQERQLRELTKNVRRVDPSRDHIYGNPDAIITMIEYSDYECPYCKHFHATPKQVVGQFDGKVNWVYRHFPLPFHNPGAQKQAEGSECAAELGGNNAFWMFTDAIYDRTTSNGNGFSLAALPGLARELGLDTDVFDECLNSGRYAARVNEDLEEGSSIGINGTPGTILLNNETGETMFINGALPVEGILAEINILLAEEDS